LQSECQERKGFLGGLLANPSDRERRGAREEGLSNLAKNLRTAERYVGASTTLVVSVGAFTALGYWLDKKLGHQVPWLLMVGAVVGMIGGFVSFFRTVLGTRKKK
jgi:ATP synthase protein I